MTRSFTENGTPWSGPSEVPRRVTARSAAFASARACSAVTRTYAFTTWFSVSIRSSTESITSTGETFLARIRVARREAGSQQSSSLATVEISLIRGLEGRADAPVWPPIPPTFGGRRETRRPPLQPSRPAETRIERVAKSVAEQVRSEHREADRDAREEHQPGRFLRVLGSGHRQHAAPGRIRLGHAEPEERQRGFGQDRAPELRRREHDERPHRVGQDVTKRDPEMPDAERPRRLDVLHLTDREHAGADDARRARDDRDRDRDHHVLHGWPERRRHDERQHQQREALEDVEDALGDEIALAPEVRREQADDAAEDRAGERRQHADDERDARAVHDAAIDVAPQVIAAQPVVGAR